MLLQAIKVRFHRVSAMVETRHDDSAVHACDHAIVDIHCAPDEGACMSLDIGLRKYTDTGRDVSDDLGVTVTLDFNAKEAEGLLYTLKTVLRQNRWHMAHPTPATPLDNNDQETEVDE